MHISLDSALGREQRLNSLGESVLQIAPNAAAAYSLRSLTGGDPKVVRVRRDVDNTEQDFTASGVSSGALVDFATSGNGVFANAGYESFTNASASGFTASNTGSTGFAVSDISDGVSGNAVSVSFDIDITNGSPSISLRTVLDGGSTASNSATYTSSGSKSATLTATKSYVGIGFTEGDAPSNFTVSNFKVLGNGFVDTWYDQSGNGNHAINDTDAEQPKIVSSGSLIADGIDFDGSDDTLTAASVSGFGATISMFSASVRDSGGAAVLSMGSSASTANTNFGIIEGGTVSNVNARNTTSVTASASVSGVTRLTFGLTTGQTSTKSGALGGTLSENTSDYGSDFTSGELDTIFLGKLRSGSGSSFNGHIKEALIYTTDQSSNRDAIEANIANYYNITLV